jgi:hypothetical protein
MIRYKWQWDHWGAGSISTSFFDDAAFLLSAPDGTFFFWLNILGTVMVLLVESFGAPAHKKQLHLPFNSYIMPLSCFLSSLSIRYSERNLSPLSN